MKRYAVRIAYPGDRFFGSQVQPGLRTVEGQVLQDLQLVTKQDAGSLDVRFSSRTDKGVSALGNVLALSTDMDIVTLLKAVNANSKDVFYTGFAEVGEGFNPRHASARTYRYTIPRCDDPASIGRNARLFVGEHDFKRFCRPDGKPTVLTVDSVDAEPFGDGIILTFRARYFLWNMIRRMTGALLDVDAGSRTPEDISRALDGEDICFGMADPGFLVLEKVEYPGIEFTKADPSPYGERLSECRDAASAALSFFGSLRCAARTDHTVRTSRRSRTP
jgi:tRNA pseudouridine38-40 synthase